MVELSYNVFEVTLIDHRFDHVHDQLALLIEELVEYLLLGLWEGPRVEGRTFEAMFGLLVYAFNRLHDVVAIEAHPELRDLEVVPDRLSDTHQ